ncbi:putative succinate-semialdehyde dehydrogenase [Dactylonectria macrodidyma]|uniref:Succinate-semialdehyde dehydrogenase n=1 Tax=Dactylonectria macrodidyma TaxID=307937 RepID=A0A9P9IG09_9HYPO|nr:putative succinate-semialdehyde dehydrogenase [Dactylonectria macrodidyma]
MAVTESFQVPFQLQDPTLLKQQSFVDGKWVESYSGARFEIVDPGTGKAFASCPINDVQDVGPAVQASHAAFERYRATTPRQRAQWMLRWHDLISASKNDIATILIYETGKPRAEAMAELDYALGFPWWFAGEAERTHGTTGYSAIANRRTMTIKQPIGVAVALVPWNFPIAMILRKASAALAAGCTMIIKPSPETPLSVLSLVELALRAGFGQGVLTVLTTDLNCTPGLSESLCRHPLVRKVTFTGSTRIGKLIARHCSDGLKKVTLELGGNCPFIVFDDADIRKAVDALVLLKWRHAGQACITANRVFVQSGVYNEFQRLFIEETRKLVMGHGDTTGTTLGPLTTLAGVEKVNSQAKDAVAHGGKLAHGGRRPDNLGGGYFFEPTVISDANFNMQVASEETFGPLCALFRFDTEEEAVRAANDTSMGLASYFFTKDVNRSWRLLEKLEAGMIGINTGGFCVPSSCMLQCVTLAKLAPGNQSAAESPFGGIKESGYGKESGKDVAIEEYLITKSATLTVSED